MDVFSTELGIRLSVVKTLEFRGAGAFEPPLGTPLFATALMYVKFNYMFHVSI
jgi:hypothetical protein